MIKVLCFLTWIAFSTSAFCEDMPKGYNTPIPLDITTPDTVNTRIGTFNFFDGFPTEETAAHVYDNLDFMRGIEAFLNAVPAVSVEAMRNGARRLVPVQAIKS